MPRIALTDQCFPRPLSGKVTEESPDGRSCSDGCGGGLRVQAGVELIESFGQFCLLQVQDFYVGDDSAASFRTRGVRLRSCRDLCSRLQKVRFASDVVHRVAFQVSDVTRITLCDL